MIIPTSLASANSQRGFSLLEMMVVLAIIAILALVAMPSQTVSSLMQHREQVVEGYERMQKLQDPVRKYRLAFDECPDNVLDDVDEFGIAPGEAYSGHFVNSVVTGGDASDGGGCTITATFKLAKTNAHLKQKSLTMQLFALELGVPKWACYTDVEQQGYLMLPRVCRFASADEARQSQEPEPN